MVGPKRKEKNDYEIGGQDKDDSSYKSHGGFGMSGPFSPPGSYPRTPPSEHPFIVEIRLSGPVKGSVYPIFPLQRE